LVNFDSLTGSYKRKINNSRKIKLSKYHFEYFKNKTLIPIYSKFKERDYNILLIGDSRDIKDNYQEEPLLITVKKELILSDDALDYIENPNEVFLVGMLNKLEVWNNQHFEKYEHNTKSLDKLLDQSDLKIFGKIPF